MAQVVNNSDHICSCPSVDGFPAFLIRTLNFLLLFFRLLPPFLFVYRLWRPIEIHLAFVSFFPPLCSSTATPLFLLLMLDLARGLIAKKIESKKKRCQSNGFAVLKIWCAGVLRRGSTRQRYEIYVPVHSPKLGQSSIGIKAINHGTSQSGLQKLMVMD